MKLSVIIPCLNCASTIGAQLDALASQKWQEPWEVLFCDNGSTDHSQTVAKRYMDRIPSLRIVDASMRRGQPYALNTGAKQAEGESLAFCDADDVVGSGWLAAMGQALDEYDFVAARFDIQKLNASWVQKTRKNSQLYGLQKYTYPNYLPHAGGGSLGVKRFLHDAVGGFDESFPILHDTDYCWKIQHRGTKLHFVSNAVVHVRFHDRLSGIYRQGRNYGEYNVKLYWKYRNLGMGKLSLGTGLKNWANLLRTLPQVRNQEKLARYLRILGWNVGRLKGCIKYRVIAL